MAWLGSYPSLIADLNIIRTACATNEPERKHYPGSPECLSAASGRSTLHCLW